MKTEISEKQKENLKKNIISKLEEVYDPEIGIDVWSLELIYSIEIIINKRNYEVNILMTLTSPTCPFAELLIQEVEEKILELKNIKKVNIQLTFDPLWKPSPELRAILGV